MGRDGIQKAYETGRGLITLRAKARIEMAKKSDREMIIVDVVYVPMYVYKHLPVTAVLYAVFLALAVLGLRSWWRSYRAKPIAEPAAA